MDKWRSSHQPGNKIANINTQIIHNRNSSSSNKSCSNCTVHTIFGGKYCGCNSYGPNTCSACG